MAENGYELRLIKDVLPAHSDSVQLPPDLRVIYCHRGSVRFADGSELGLDEARMWRDATRLRAGPSGAELWRWELAPADREPVLQLGQGIESRIAVRHVLDGVENPRDHLIRCDSVFFPTGGTAFPHTHDGPGIRCLSTGHLRIVTNGDVQEYHPGDAWYEPSNALVSAEACKEVCTRFVRVMILPKDTKGKSSIHYVNEADREKPKSQRYKGYVDELIEL